MKHAINSLHAPLVISQFPVSSFFEKSLRTLSLSPRGNDNINNSFDPGAESIRSQDTPEIYHSILPILFLLFFPLFITDVSLLSSPLACP